MSTSPGSRNRAPGDWRPTATIDLLRFRARLLAQLRGFFDEAGVLEVETPALSPAAVTDVHLESLRVSRPDGPELGWLHTSPEFAMKRLLAGGAGDCWQLCRVFRGAEQGRRHNPEFSLLEWYRVGWSLSALMDEVAALLRVLARDRLSLKPPVSLTYLEAMTTTAGVDPFSDAPEALVAALSDHGVAVPPGLADDRDACLDLLLSGVVEPALDPERPTFIHDFPASQAALARIRPGEPPVAERFELFLGGMELANGFAELTDAREQRVRFARDLETRRKYGLPAPPVDHRFLAALEAGLPDCAGVALGFDRLVMVLAGADSIDQVLAFPWGRA
ncbi:MAG: EF-P lysine aminoacylase EpmA [Gammaproteobacteria bacterium]